MYQHKNDQETKQMPGEQTNDNACVSQKQRISQWKKICSIFTLILVMAIASSILCWKNVIKPICNRNNVADLVITLLPAVIPKSTKREEAIKKFVEEREKERIKQGAQIIKEGLPLLADYLKIRAEAKGESSRIASAILSKEGKDLEQFDNCDPGDFEFRKAKAEQDDAEQQFFIGYCYEFGKGVEKNFEEAVNWYQKAAENGHVDAMWYLGLRYEAGRDDVLVWDIGRNRKASQEWYSLAASQGHQAAIDRLDMLRAQPSKPMTSEEIRNMIHAVELMPSVLKEKKNLSSE